VTGVAMFNIDADKLVSIDTGVLLLTLLPNLLFVFKFTFATGVLLTMFSGFGLMFCTLVGWFLLF